MQGTGKRDGAVSVCFADASQWCQRWSAAPYIDHWRARSRGRGLTFAPDWSNEINMNIEELKKAHDLMKQIEATASLLSAYRKAEAIVVAIPQTDAEKRSLRGAAGLPRHDEVTFTTAEIGDQMVSALERRVAMMTEELQKLGVETAPRLSEV
jgi:hypothetical protein